MKQDTKGPSLIDIYTIFTRHKRIPERFPDPEGDMYEFYNRDKFFLKSLGFVKISKSWIRPLAAYLGTSKVLEIMAGNGALTKALRDERVKIIATDDQSWGEKAWFDENAWTPVENLDALDAIRKYGKETDYIICSWPPYENPIAYQALLLMREVNSNCKMIYIGEGMGGCTADDKFHESAIYVDDPEFEKAVKNFQRWKGLHDNPYLIK